MAGKKIVGVPKVWIKMLRQSYSAREVLRSQDGSIVWFHAVQNGFNSEKNPVYEEKIDKKHEDQNSYTKFSIMVELPGGEPIRVFADNAAGLLVTSQAIWCKEENEAAGFVEDDILEQFCPEAHRGILEATMGDVA